MSGGFTGFQTPGASSGDYNAQSFVIQQHMRRMSTSTVVKVMSVTNAGALSPVGFVDIQPQVDLVDGAGVKIPHGTIYKCPYFRYQGGANAIILDPQVGDLGIALFADRDISSVIANKGQAAPGSARRFDMADGIYIGGLLNGTPTQFIQFNSDGITATSPISVTVNAPSVSINAASSCNITSPLTTVDGNLAVTSGATGSFTTPSGNLVSVQDGIITNIT